jgi:hypothetical protein
MYTVIDYCYCLFLTIFVVVFFDSNICLRNTARLALSKNKSLKEMMTPKEVIVAGSLGVTNI